MDYSKYLIKPFRMDDEDEPDQDPKEERVIEVGMLMKKTEKYFFETRSVYLWGPVHDKSARDIVTKLLFA